MTSIRSAWNVRFAGCPPERCEAAGTTFPERTGPPESRYAAHGGGVPLVVDGTGMVGVLLVSGLPQVDDHALAVEVLRGWLAGDRAPA